MRDEQKRPADDRANPDTLSRLLASDSTASEAPTFVRLAWQSWRERGIEAQQYAFEVPAETSIAAAIRAEWHVDTGGDE